ncbi:hypothetical protein HYV50_03550 [Candidatus Pacearchaeota archaeon]|nr:hypothetical protein [Candidatus Pacearchaeota archaeon]
MPKIRNLSEILESFQREIDDNKKHALQTAEKFVSAVYRDVTKNPDYVQQVTKFLDVLEEGARTGLLEVRIAGLVKYLDGGQETAEEIKREWNISFGGAVKYMRALQKRSGERVLSISGNRARILNSEKIGALKVRRESPRKAYVNIKELNDIYNPEISPSKIYYALRDAGLSLDDIKEFFGTGFYRGRNIGKFFGGLEGTYQRYKRCRGKRY